jgi:gluconolactonase
MHTPELTILATGLAFPEGPVCMRDGSLLFVEIAAGRVSRLAADGTLSVFSACGGGPNGLAVGPDGALYLCNSGGFLFHAEGGITRTRLGTPADYFSGRIERLDPATGAVTLLYDKCGGRPLRGPNDIVFDTSGGFYFTDLGKQRERDRDHGGVYYARADGSLIREIVFPITTPNGIGLSPDGRVLYVAETETARLWGVRTDRTGRVHAPPLPLAPWRPSDLRSWRIPALRQPRGRQPGTHLRRDPVVGLHDRCVAGGRQLASAGDA